MSKKVVLIVDEDSHRAEKLLFIVRLGGYETRTFNGAAAALNWAKYGCADGEILCLLFNHPGELTQAEEIFATWTASGMIVPVVLLQRGKGSWNQLLTIGEKDHFFVCEPESVLQTLDILLLIEYAGNGAEAGQEFLAAGDSVDHLFICHDGDH